MLLGYNWQKRVVKDGSHVSHLCDWEDTGNIGRGVGSGGSVI